MRSHFRDAKAWIDIGMKITGANDELCKLYDSSISNSMSWGYEKGYGPPTEVSEKLEKYGKECVLVQSLLVGFGLLNGRTIYDDEKVKKTMEDFLSLVNQQEGILTQREKNHALAVKQYSEGDVDGAFMTWEHILADHPTDVHAFFVYFFTLFAVGASEPMMRLANRVIPYYKKDTPLREYAIGLQAFTTEEAGYLDKAEKIAMENIENYGHDAFSYHAMAHVYEMTRRLDEGKKFMEKTFDKWEPADAIACHIVWHNCLFYAENCEYESAVEVYESKLKKYLGPKKFLAYTDVASLFYRLDMAGYDVGKERWRELNTLSDTFIDTTFRPFHASHILMTTLCSDDKVRSDKIIANVQSSLPLKNSFSMAFTDQIGNSLFSGMVKFQEQQYDEATELFRPIRQHLYKVGGSHAQRDVYQQLICYSALKSTSKHNQNFARQLVAERQAEMAGPLTDKMANRLMAFHFANE